MTNYKPFKNDFTKTQPKKSGGVTLVELLIVLATAAILVQLAIPQFSDMMKNNRSTAGINELQTSLFFARTEAVQRNRPVVMCKSSNGTECQDSGEDWQMGWIVFADANGDGSVSTGEDILSLHVMPNNQFSLTFTETRVTYAGNGLAIAGLNGTYKLCDDRGAEHAKGVIISASGRPRLATDSDDSGVVEGATGTDLSCS